MARCSRAAHSHYSRVATTAPVPCSSTWRCSLGAVTGIRIYCLVTTFYRWCAAFVLLVLGVGVFVVHYDSCSFVGLLVEFDCLVYACHTYPCSGCSYRCCCLRSTGFVPVGASYRSAVTLPVCSLFYYTTFLYLPEFTAAISTPLLIRG